MRAQAGPSQAEILIAESLPLLLRTSPYLRGKKPVFIFVPNQVCL